MQARVDTSSAGFRRTPTYVANVVGGRELTPGGALLDGYPSVVQPSPVGFTLQLAMPRNLQAGARALNPSSAFNAALLAVLRTGLRWSVSWIGVEA